MMNVLVTGSNGQLGSELQYGAKDYPTWNFFFVDKDELDIVDQEAVFRFFEAQHFDYCINCAAFTAVDKAEEEVELTQAVNVQGAENLAKACSKYKVQFIHISTDYVYHNSVNRPLQEEDENQPKGIYAVTKFDGEKASIKANADTMIIRTSWVYSSFGNNFVKTMLRLGESRAELTVIYDQIGTPTYARDLALAILKIIANVESGKVAKEKMKGIFNYSNEGVTSWYDFAKAIFVMSNIECRVKAIETKDYPSKVERPLYSLMNKAKIKNTFDIEIPHWLDSLADCLAEIELKEA